MNPAQARVFSFLLLSCVSGLPACHGEDPSSTSTTDGGAASSGGAALAGTATAGSLGDAGAGGALIATCADDAPAPPNAWASWVLSDPTTEGEANSQRFTSTDAVATDDVTKLEWQRHAPDDSFTWSEAKQYCACLSLEDHDDWQLPSRMELVSIVDYTRQNPSIDAEAFPATPFEWFWSASPLPGEDRHWYVAFFDGNTHASTPEQDYRVRCVRRAEGSLPRYDTTLAGTVKDQSTRLTWQREASQDRFTWADAQLVCAGLTLAGGGWRLPSMSELQSLIDETKTEPAIDSVAFPTTPSEGFWAATPFASAGTAAAWFVSFSEGVAYNAAVDHQYRARCVR